MSKNIAFLRFGLILLLAGACAAYFLPGVSSQSAITPDDTSEDIPPPIKADRIGFPRISYKDGNDLYSDTADRSGVSAKVMASGDFDSDGTVDLITADSSGAVRIYRGNVDSIYQNSPDAQTRRQSGTFVDSAFYRGLPLSGIPTSPDFFAAGDFNADGHQDIVAAANGGSAVYLLAGDGRGNLSQAREFKIDGEITAMASGEIGRRDGQADIAIAVKQKGGFGLLVFEHPEGAFARKPEHIALRSAANAIAIGNLDTDPFADIAVASGNRLTLVRGRGHAYPWDMIADSGIERPKAISETRTMPFSISALAIGDFSDSRVDSLAMLSGSGSVEVLSTPPVPTRPISTSTASELRSGDQFLPAGVTHDRYRSLGNGRNSDGPAANQLEMFPADPKDREEYLREKNEKATGDFAKLSPEQQNASIADALRSSDESSERAKAGFLNAISPIAAEPLSRWNSHTLTTDSRLATAASSAGQLHRVRISDSGRDELAFTDPSSNKIHLLIRETVYRTGTAPNELVSFEMASRPLAMLPMRLNSDAISDLVVLRDGSDSPTVVLSAPAATYVVNSSGNEFSLCNGSTCTLRGAINAATESVGPDMITFNIGGATTINLETQLPIIFGATTVDATTQPGYAGTPVVEINGLDAPVKSDGLRVNGSNNVVRGFVINRFKGEFDEGLNGFVGGNGISVFSFSDEGSGQNNIIEGNYSGTSVSGTSDQGNDFTALNIFNSNLNIIGGTTAAARNVLSGSGTNNAPGFPVRKIGVGIAIRGGMDNLFQGNYIGTNATGTAKINNSAGVRLAGGRNRFGGDEPGAGNVISGNGDPFTIFRPDGCLGPGIEEESIINFETGEFVTTGNSYKGNKIGTRGDGTAAISNCGTGMLVSPRHSSLIGSITESGRNTISGNLENGIYCSAVFRGFDLAPELGEVQVPEGFCSINGNNIGTDVTGNSAIPNIDYNNYVSFIIFFGTTVVHNTETLSTIGAPGGTTDGGCTGFCNLISGNGTADSGEGAYRGSVLGEVGIFNNYIGTNKNGSAAVPNGAVGFLSFEGGLTRVGAIGVGEGGGSVSFGNLISGNRVHAINMESSFNQRFIPQRIEGNLIGTDRTGTAAIPNSTSSAGASAVQLVGIRATIGGTDPLSRNVISGNAGNGVLFSGTGYLPKLYNNHIGVDRNGQTLGNAGNGVSIFASNVTVGGSEDQANVIAHNGGRGVYVFARQNFQQTQSSRNSIRFNSIHSNAALGIDLTVRPSLPLTPDGVTANDCLDIDTQANDLQNFPVLTAPVFNGDGTVSVEGAFQSSVSQGYVIDFYSNSTNDPSNYGEGQTYIGSRSVETDNNGQATFVFTSTVAVAPGLKITATATDGAGNTSEFSCFAGQCEGGTGGLAEILKDMELVCLVPIVVNVDTDQPDTSPSNGVCDVDLSTPGLQCSLRGAIQTANGKPGFDLIQFDIPGGGVKTISPTTQLPSVDEIAIIDATTQPGYTSAPLIEINGSLAGSSYGLILSPGSDGSRVLGFAINRFTNGGITVNSSRNRVEKSYFGLNANGTAAGTPGQQAIGVDIRNSNVTENLIGGSGSFGNVISNNGIGVAILNGSTGNQVAGNKIGTDVAGTAAIPNQFGVVILSASANIIGDNETADSNLISGNTTMGVILDQGSANNFVSNNAIGIRSNGTEVLPNGEAGIFINAGARNNTIDKNVIGGHNLGSIASGVAVAPNAGQTNSILGNFVGVGRNGTAPLPNKYGILNSGNSQTIGSQNGGNTIGFNETAGIWISADPASSNPVVENNTIQNNLVGTNGTADIGNVEIGILVNGEARNNTVSRNIVSGNDGFGIVVADGANNNTVSENIVGTNLAGNTAIPNGGGIWVRQARDNAIASNLVSGNSVGILVGTNIGFEPTRAFVERYSREHPAKKLGEAAYTSGNRLIGNVVGLNAARNAALSSSIGIAIGENARNNQIGESSNYNLVSGNTTSLGYGIFLGTLTAEPSEDMIPQQNKFQGNVIGLDGSLQTPIANKVGFVLLQASNNLIGGDTRDLGNTIVGSTQDGIQITDGTRENTIIGNFIGTLPPTANRTANGYRVAGNGQSYGNGGDGIKMLNSFLKNRLFNNAIGNNAGNGISIQSPFLPAKGEPHTEIAGNTIGVIINPNGNVMVSIANGLSGVYINGTKGVRIGGLGVALKNIIGSNALNGIRLLDSSPTNETETPTVIEGNDIGAYVSSGATLGNIGNNLAGILIERTDRVQVGSANAGNLIGNNILEGVRAFSSQHISIESNVVVKNQSAGINIIGGAFANIASNSIGIFESLGVPSQSLGNMGDGVIIEQSPGAVIGGETQSTWNLIGSNSGSGLTIKSTHPTASAPVPTVITGNLVGGRTTGFGSVVSRASNAVGIRIDNSSNIRIGSFNPAASNSVVASTSSGLSITGSLSNSITAINNGFGKLAAHHGTEGESMGNGEDGVLLEDGANNNTIGDEGPQPRRANAAGSSSNGNTIESNGRNGITLAATAGNDNRIGGNRIFGNSSFGIDLGGNGFSLNDPGDADVGPNKLQNYPDIFSKQIVNDELIVTFRVDSAPENSTYGKSGIYVEFFKADVTGQGERSIGSTFYTLADYNARTLGTKTVNLGNIVTLGITPLDNITATATDANGNTSEFTPIFTPTSAGVEISGRVTTPTGSPIRNAVVTMTDTAGAKRSVVTSGFGYFRFENIETGKTYVVDVKARHYSFEPRLLSVLDAMTEVNFVAIE